MIYHLQVTGAVYGFIDLILGRIFVKKDWEMLQNKDDKQIARSLFLYSILYMMLLCAGMVVDSLPITHQLTNAIAASLHQLISSILSHHG